MKNHFHLPPGDDGVAKEVSSGVLMKESENVYALWCSGRQCVEGMLVELKLLKRQDLINLLLRIFKPASDQIVRGKCFVLNICYLFLSTKLVFIKLRSP